MTALLKNSYWVALQTAAGVLLGAFLILHFSALDARSSVSFDQSVFGPERWWNSEVPAHIASTRIAYHEFGPRGLFAGAAWTVGGSGYLAEPSNPIFDDPMGRNAYAVGQLRFVEGQGYVSFPPGLFLLNAVLPDVAACEIAGCMLHVLPLAIGLGLFVAGLFLFLNTTLLSRQFGAPAWMNLSIGFCLGATPIVGAGIIGTFWAYSGLALALGCASYFAARERVTVALASLGLGFFFSFTMFFPLVLFGALAVRRTRSRSHVLALFFAVLSVPSWFLLTFDNPLAAARSLFLRATTRSFLASSQQVSFFDAGWHSLAVSGAIGLATLLVVIPLVFKYQPSKARLFCLTSHPFAGIIISVIVLLLIEHLALRDHWIVYSFSHILLLPVASLPIAILFWKVLPAVFPRMTSVVLIVGLSLLLFANNAVFVVTYDSRFAYDARSDTSLLGLPVAHFQENLFVYFR